MVNCIVPVIVISVIIFFVLYFISKNPLIATSNENIKNDLMEQFHLYGWYRYPRYRYFYPWNRYLYYPRYYLPYAYRYPIY